MSFIASDLVLDFFDPVLAGLLIVDVVTSLTAVVFWFSLAKRGDTCRPVSRCVEWIRPWWSLFVAINDVPATGGDEVGLDYLGPFSVVVLAREGGTLGQWRGGF